MSPLDVILNIAVSLAATAAFCFLFDIPKRHVIFCALLGSAGYALSRSDTADLIVRFFLRRGVHDLFAVNDALFAHNQPLLAGVQA